MGIPQQNNSTEFSSTSESQPSYSRSPHPFDATSPTRMSNLQQQQQQQDFDLMNSSGGNYNPQMQQPKRSSKNYQPNPPQLHMSPQQQQQQQQGINQQQQQSYPTSPKNLRQAHESRLENLSGSSRKRNRIPSKS